MKSKFQGKIIENKITGIKGFIFYSKQDKGIFESKKLVVVSGIGDSLTDNSLKLILPKVSDENWIKEDFVIEVDKLNSDYKCIGFID